MVRLSKENLKDFFHFCPHLTVRMGAYHVGSVCDGREERAKTLANAAADGAA